MEALDNETIMIFVMFGIMILVALIACIINVLGMWKLFNKAGQAGWKSLIPIYNQIIMCNISGVSPWWILIVYCASIVGIFASILSFVGTIATVYFNVILCVSVAKSFNKDEAYAVGLFFLGSIFRLILGFGKSEYVGPRPMNDPIMDLINKK